MLKLALWLLLLVICWPVAVLALLLYPLVWLLLIPFRILGIAVDGVLELLWSLLFLPSRILGGRSRAYTGRPAPTGEGESAATPGER